MKNNSSTMTRCSHQQSPYQLLFGEPYIFEDLLGLKIQISPDAFFQINTAGAEILYQIIRELRRVNSDSILLDTCCGTDHRVVRAVRNCRAIHTLVFVSGKPPGESTRNFIERLPCPEFQTYQQLQLMLFLGGIFVQWNVTHLKGMLG